MVKELCWECTGLGGPAIGVGYCCRVCLGTGYIEMKGVEIYNKDTSISIVEISKDHKGFFVTRLGEVFEVIGEEILPRVELRWKIEGSIP